MGYNQNEKSDKITIMNTWIKVLFISFCVFLGLIFPKNSYAYISANWEGKYYLYQNHPDGTVCYYDQCIEDSGSTSPLTFEVIVTAARDIRSFGGYSIGDPFRGNVRVLINGRKVVDDVHTDAQGMAVFHFPYWAGNHRLQVFAKADGQLNPLWNLGLKIADVPLKIHTACSADDLANCTGRIHFGQMPYAICDQVRISDVQTCRACMFGGGVWTAVGCIPTDPTRMIQVLMKIGLLIGGGVALLIILAGSFILSISQGDPKKTSEAKEMIASALIGLVFIIFSVSILQFIGLDLLQIPGFG